MIGKGAISAKDCERLINEIKNAKSFDDMIMGGRNRINKGSKNFKNYLKNSKLSNNLYKQFNSQSFYKKVEKKFKKSFKAVIVFNNLKLNHINWFFSNSSFGDHRN